MIFEILGAISQIVKNIEIQMVFEGFLGGLELLGELFSTKLAPRSDL